jgi:hypothetical protein
MIKRTGIWKSHGGMKNRYKLQAGKPEKKIQLLKARQRRRYQFIWNIKNRLLRLWLAENKALCQDLIKAIMSILVR